MSLPRYYAKPVVFVVSAALLATLLLPAWLGAGYLSAFVLLPEVPCQLHAPIAAHHQASPPDRLHVSREAKAPAPARAPPRLTEIVLG